MFQENTANQIRSLSILHEVEIIYNSPKFKEPVKLQRSTDTYELLKEVYDFRTIDYKESFYVLLLNKANTCIGVSKIEVGSTSGVVVNVKEIYQLALRTNASYIIISHNHPGGNLKESEADRKITRTVKVGCELLDIELLDHVIMTSDGYFSFSDEGIL